MFQLYLDSNQSWFVLKFNLASHFREAIIEIDITFIANRKMFGCNQSWFAQKENEIMPT